ncbi:MAG TPA: hypothetical protein DCO86_02285 [Spirochaetaceae bacterium]|nr:hypothetical protein [Spirochaetaceae bacterium]
MMALIEFAGICAFWLVIYITVKIVYWSFGLNKGKKQMISLKLQRLMKELRKVIDSFNSFSGAMGFSETFRKIRKIHNLCMKVEKRFNIYMFDNPDSKGIDGVRRNFIESKNKYSEKISEVFADDERNEVTKEELEEISSDLEKLYKLCEVTNRWIVQEIERTNKREAFKF